MLLVFALIFAPVAARTAHAACVELGALPAIPTGATTTPWSVTTADLDGDGDDDVLASLYSASANALVWYENDGSAGGWSATTIPAGDGPIQAIAADLDGDGDLDLAAGVYRAASVVWFENSSGDGSTWNAFSVGTLVGARFVTPADVDGDGDLDLVAAGFASNAVVWFENDGTPTVGSWPAVTISGAAAAAYAVAAADVDGDGDLDVVSASAEAATVAWYENSAAGGDGTAWVTHAILTAAIAAGSVAVGDVDGDGDLDVAAGTRVTGSVAWFLNDGTPAVGAWPIETVSTASAAISVVPLDFDRDGDLDLVSGGFDFTIAGTTSTWHENLGGGTWRDHAVVTSGTAVSGIAAADLDGDGDLELVTADRGTNELELSNNLTLHDQPLFAPAATVVSGGSPGTIRIADLDGDGDLDLLSTLFSNSALSWFENAAPGGDGSSWSRRTIGTAAEPALVSAAADLDGDGDRDVLAAGYASGILWYRNLAGDAASWSLATIFSAAAGAYDAVAADVDGDGDLDAVSALYSTGEIAWHENSSVSGDGSTWVTQTVATGVAGAFAVAAADLDGDGDFDVASVAFAGDAIFWHANLPPGDGSSWTTHTVSPVGEPKALVAADVDGDGDLDLVSSSGVFTPQLTWYENVDLGGPGTGNGTNWSDHSIAVELASGTSISAADADGDGDLDLFATMVFGDNVVWYENDGSPGNGEWTSHVVAGALNGSTGVATADLDGDGDLDAASFAVNLNQISWHRNLGTGVFDDGFDSDADSACWSSATP